ncbi:MAG: Signal transduction histidine kinase, nitrate/nitrite-specific [uncultured Aureispira sp.]|uniref:Signal transduction histidine kinase, nitrate/nitrite-specific n=1 Tax=uncultured Aureispira sp. TaxID=1331704 RepID=A0A6S6RVJ6_9BACT|nr:MAG: Signal transduction histidine kinase, nitrate/nitrite-specific [uncultured Aureispira sp.]
MKTIFSLIMIASFAISSLNATTLSPSTSKPLGLSIYEAINKAGYQRMLTQRIAKSYMIIIGNLDPAKHKEHLKGSARLFENNLKELKEYAPTDDIKSQFRYVEILWRNYKFIYSDDFSEENALIILKFNEKILKACNDAVTLLEQYAVAQTANKDQEMINDKNGLSNVINVSGRQRMLSQRLLFFTVTKFNKIGDEAEVNRKFSEALGLFNSSLKNLISNAQNTEEIDTELLNITNRWEEVEKNIMSVMGASEITVQEKDKLIDAIKLSEQVLFSFDEVVFLYERVAESKKK